MGLGSIFGIVDKTVALIDKAVPDKDLAAQLKNDLETLREQAHIVALQTPTVPWVDALHKMGRQLFSYAQLIFYGACVAFDITITPEIVAGVSGPGSIYNFVKGKGK